MQEREKTETRTIRFTLTQIKRMEKAAERLNVSVNEFVVALVEERLLVDPLIPAFRGMTFDSDTIESFLVSANIDVLEAMMSEKVQRNVLLILKLYETRRIPMDFWKYLVDVLGGYCQWFYVEGSDEATHKWIMLRHSYGLKWSRCVKSYILSGYNAISKDKIRVEISDQWIRIEFQPS